MNNLLWEKAVEFHGHKCPGLAIGVKACEGIISKLGKDKKDYNIICVSENKTCPVDAIKLVFGCDSNKGNLFYKESEELAFNVFDIDNDVSFRIIYKGNFKTNSKEEHINCILQSDANDIFDFTDTKYDY